MASFMVGGCLAIEPQFGEAGSEIRGDCQVTLTTSDKLEIELKSTVSAMYGRIISDQVKAIATWFGNPPLRIAVNDTGALPYVIEARIVAALSHATGQPAPRAESVMRQPIRNRLRRTRLYVPGNTPKFFPNCALLGPDCVILDLEDSVTPQAKWAARMLVGRALASVNFGDSEVCVRINEGDAGLEDVRHTAPNGVEVFYVPKVESAETLKEVSHVLDEVNSPAMLIPIIESALGVERCFDIVQATHRVIAVSLGYEDYVRDLRVERTTERTETLWAENRIVNAARASGVMPLASVIGEVDDHERVSAYAKRCFAMGYEGVGCIHPSQIALVHRAATPDAELVMACERIVEAFEKAQSQGLGAVAVDGKMIDKPVYEQALTTLRKAGMAL